MQQFGVTLAIKDFKKCMALDPSNAAARVQLDATTKLVRRLEFEKAIASEDEEATSKRIRKLISEGATDVVKTEDGWKPSLEFIQGMLEWFKAGKTYLNVGFMRSSWVVKLNRGNHETADMNKVYGFEGETKKKYSELCYKLFEEVFCALPLCCLGLPLNNPSQARYRSAGEAIFDAEGRNASSLSTGAVLEDKVSFDS
ncbi:hypothetical protein KEM48_014260 [Puccinia striiformis f. sp. tritici PST-130]|nr:hypothetical protein KEM48_014260 [Puccinia striiformis f. sp. tritici PST-130]